MVCIPAIANLLCYFFVQIVFGNCSCPASKTIPAQLALSIVRTFPFKIALPIAVILVYSPFISCSSACSGLLDITWLQFHPPWYHSPVCGQPVQRLGCPARPQSALLPGCECPQAVVTLLPAPCMCWAESCLQSCLCLLCVFSPNPSHPHPGCLAPSTGRQYSLVCCSACGYFFHNWIVSFWRVRILSFCMSLPGIVVCWPLREQSANTSLTHLARLTVIDLENNQ